jgi:hypothetical protein
MSGGFRKPTLAPLPTAQEWAAQANAERSAPDRPWLSADPTRDQPFTARIPLPLYVKLTWLKANLPGGPSLKKQVVDAAEEWADRMIAQLEERRR